MPMQETIDSLAIRVHPRCATDVVGFIKSQVNADTPATIAAHNLHSVYLFHTNPEFKTFYDEADIVLIDGWPVLAALNHERRRGGRSELPKSYRVGSTDWIPNTFLSGGVSRVCVLGASAESNAAFIDHYSTRHPEINFLGLPGHPWSEALHEASSAALRDFSPELTLVAMGMPLQEQVVADLRRDGVGGIIATVGGAVDQLSGKQALAPRWTGACKLEWLYRLASDPRRLAHRYLIEPFKLVNVLREMRNT